MSISPESSDTGLLDLLRRDGSATVADLVEELGVTATAVRQRLTRLMAEGLIERVTERQTRGRPNHRYSLTEKGLRLAGTNYADLAITLWEELRAIKDPEVKRGMLQRLALRMADQYRGAVGGQSVTERLQELAGLMGQRDVPFEVDESGELPVLTALACPYPELAQQDRSICSLEKMLFSEIVGEGIRLTACRLDGANCCTFETVPS